MTTSRRRRWRHAATVLTVLAAAAACSPASAQTALMTEDIPVFGSKSVDGRPVDPALTEYGYSVAGYMGARFMRLHTGRDASFSFEAKMDPFVADATRRGFQPYLTLTYRPEYRAGPDISYMGLPTVDEFGAWCAEAAARYSTSVFHYGVFNEPNYFGDGMTPRYYNELYRRCRDEIKARNPLAQVYYGEIAAGEDSGDPCGWVAQSLSSRSPTVSDGLAIHTYQWTRPPDQPDPDGLCRGIGRLPDWTTMAESWSRDGRSLSAPTGSRVPLLVTEHGYCAPHGECPAASDGSGVGSRLGDITRAGYAREAYEWASANGVALFGYYHLFNQPTGANLWDSGIVGLDGAVAPAVRELRAAVLTDLVAFNAGGPVQVHPGLASGALAPPP